MTMQHYVITFSGYTGKFEDAKIYNYCFFSLPTNRAQTLIPLKLHQIDIHEETIYSISTKTLDEGVFCIIHALGIWAQVEDWLVDIGAQFIVYSNKIGLKIIQGKPTPKYVRAIGSFDLALSPRNPKYNECI